MNNKVRYLFKNIGLLTISQFSSKFLVFILVPLYTNILTTEQYGIYDVFYTTVSLLIPILMVNITDAVLRFSLDGSIDRDKIFSVGVTVYGRGLLVFGILVAVNYFVGILPVLNLYIPYLILMFTITSVYEILVGYARGCDAVFDVAVAGIISTFVTVSLNILLLLVAKWGLDGYFCANIAGVLCAAVYLVVRMKIWRRVRFAELDRDLKRSMIVYSFPLMLTSVSWWVNSFSSRYVILGFCGVAANGIYSVAYKIPSILTAFQEVFNKAWVLSSVKTFDREDMSGFFAKTYRVYNGVMTLVCSVIIVATRLLAGLLFAKDFYAAWQYVPFLTISVVFGAISGYLGGIFAAVKDTKAYAVSTIIGAVLNLASSLVLVQFIGPMGAAVAAMVSYVIVWLIRMLLVRKHIKLRLRLKRDCIAYMLLVLQTIALLYLPEGIGAYALLLLVSVVIAGLFYKEVDTMAKSVLKKRN